ncbi:MAG: RNA polymerase factor sigma-32 [Desulfovibrio sp.]|nr:RNA polymerase factor sigma-32 [Desulfovibrio sp.]
MEPEVLPPDEPPEKDPDEKNEGDGDLEPDEGAEPDDIVDIDDLPDLDKDFGDGLAITDDAGTPDDPASTLPAPSQTRLPKPKATRDNLFLYIKEISKFPLLTPEEEQSLARKVRDKADPDAAFRLVSSHLRLVVRIAMDFQRRWMENVLDLIQEGNEGLVRAVNKFDPNRGIKFSYYATFWIKAYILKFIMDNWRMVKLGTTREQRKVFYNLHRERQNLAAQGYDADNAALSERMGVPEAVIAEMDKRLSSADVSLNTRVGKDEDGSSHMDFLPALGPGVEQNLALREMADIVRAHLKTFIPTLNERERYILENRLLAEEPVSLRQIGERYNVTRERIRQYEIRLLEKFRQHISLDIKDFSEAWIR